MSFVFTLDVAGETQIRRGFSRFADDVQDMRHAFREIADDFLEGQARQFATEGRYGTGKRWEPLKHETITAKRRGGWPLDILVRTGALRRSLTQRGGDTIRELKPLELKLGTNIPYAIFHHSLEPRRTLPRRPVIAIPERQRTRWHKIIHRHLVVQAGRAVAGM